MQYTCLEYYIFVLRVRLLKYLRPDSHAYIYRRVILSMIDPVRVTDRLTLQVANNVFEGDPLNTRVF